MRYNVQIFRIQPSPAKSCKVESHSHSLRALLGLGTTSGARKILKYADDTVIVGLITKDNEADYRDTISQVNDWCKDNFLHLNVSKTK